MGVGMGLPIALLWASAVPLTIRAAIAKYTILLFKVIPPSRPDYFEPAGLPPGRNPSSFGLFPSFALMDAGRVVARAVCALAGVFAGFHALSSSDFLASSGVPCLSGCPLVRWHSTKPAL